ncbi:MAG: hypothetical protein EAZ92_13670 [Candidatus Kapaibacterium sp.]|nr:MAG: hypothetical protein EAZ92_13670 [Candidatus Kapabacteria bacterium]
MNTCFQRFFISLLFVLSAGNLSAQSSTSTASSPALLLVPDVFTPVRSGIWRESLNPAALGESAERGELGEQGVMRFAGGYESGRFRAPQIATAILGGGFDARGLKRFGGNSETSAANAWTLAGQFRYNRSAHDSVRLSTVANPLNGNPYILADTTGGNWLRDDIQLETSLSTPLLWESLRFGANLFYGVGQGARRNDPRPLFRYRTLGFAPALLWQIASEHSLGAVFRVESRREDSELGFFANDNTFVWRMRGVASYDRIPLVSSQRVTQGVKWAGGVQYAWNEAQVTASQRRVVLVAEAYSRTDSVRDGVAEPQFAGMYLEQGVNATVSAGQMGELFGAEGLQEVRFHALSALGRGIDPIFRAANTSDIQTSAQMQARFRMGKTHQISPLNASLYLAFEDIVRRDVAADFRSQVSNLAFGISAQGSSMLGLLIPEADVVLEWRSGLQYRTPLATSIQTGAPANARGLQTALAVPDFAVRSAQMLVAEAECAVAWNTHPPLGSLWVRAGINGSLTASNHALYNQRAAVRCFFAIIL